jgi:segregation and condensation protein B
MSAGTHPDDPIPLPDLSGEWELDAEPLLELDPEPEPVAVAPEPAPPPTPPEPAAPTPHSALRTPHSAEVPPSPEQIVEAMLFVGGHPLTADAVCAAVRGLTPEGFGATIDALTRRYREQRRPYAVLPRNGGFVLAVLPKYRGLRERLFGGPREARLSQPALDVLSVVAYRQPVGKAEVDAIRGTDSGGILRQLVRLGLIAVQHRGEATTPEVRYGTTPRFLTVFGLATLDDLPRLGDTAQV